MLTLQRSFGNSSERTAGRQGGKPATGTRHQLKGSRTRFPPRRGPVCRAAADADRADHVAALLEGDAAGKDHYPAVVGGVNAEELAAGLSVLRQVLGADVERPGGLGFFDRDVDAAEPGFVHALEGQEVAAGVYDRHVHGLANLLGLFLSCGNNPPCIVQRNQFLLLL